MWKRALFLCSLFLCSVAKREKYDGEETIVERRQDQRRLVWCCCRGRGAPLRRVVLAGLAARQHRREERPQRGKGGFGAGPRPGVRRALPHTAKSRRRSSGAQGVELLATQRVPRQKQMGRGDWEHSGGRRDWRRVRRNARRHPQVVARKQTRPWVRSRGFFLLFFSK